MKRWIVMVCVAASALLAGICGLVASPARANLTLKSASLELTGTDGSFQHLAGAHPNLTFSASLPTVITNEGYEWPVEGLHELNLELPPGFVGNPTSVPACALDKFYSSTNSSVAFCRLSSQIGWADIKASTGNEIQEFHIPIYNLDPGPFQPARFGFLYLGVPTFISSAVRPDDYGVNSGSVNSDQTLAIVAASIKLWGVPADSSHDSERGEFGGSSEASPRPLLRNPTSCGPAATFTAVVDSWEHRGAFNSDSLTGEPDGAPYAFERCEDLPFKPAMAVHTTGSRADSPIGLQVEFNVPQNEAPNGRSTSDVRKVVTTLPAGMSVSDSSAQGLGACSQGELGIGSNDAPTCPDSSKIGTVKIKTPLLAEELDGDVYLAQQGANPFGTTLALYMAVKGPGFYLKLPGRVDTDPNTGQLTTTFDNTPQLPFENLRLELKSGPRAPLTSPRKCGTYAVKSEIVPWSGTAPVVEESAFEISEGCNGDFSPKLRAGTKDPEAGNGSPFTLRVIREDGEQNLAALDVALPEGLLAKLKGVTVCDGAQASSGDCPAASQVGRTVVGAGSGPLPVYVPEAGKAPTAVYLAGPYKGAPYSLVVKVPAQAGPFDLGTVAVRSGIYIDPVTTAVSVKSDRLPQILQGIPIAYRDVRVEVDRPGFMLNPTSCRGLKVTSTIAGSEGASASPSAPFAAANCDRLGFKPKLAVRFSGAPTHRGGHPALKAVLTMPKGNANIGRAQVTLPKTEFLENAHIRTICTRVQYAADNCPKASVYGFAKAWSPLLDRPLQGPVYLRSSNHTLPDLVASLDGQIHVDLSGRISSANRRIRNTFDFVPDAPVSKFVLKMQGGQRSLLVNNTELCKAKPRAMADFTGQNGKRSVTHPLVKVACGGRKK